MNKYYKREETLAGWLFMLPALIIFAILVIFPIIMSLFLSFTEWNFLSGLEGIKWVGFENFGRMFTRDRKFILALKNTLIYAFTTAPISVVLALLFAYMLNDKVYFKKMNRMFMFIPYICSMVALAAAPGQTCGVIAMHCGAGAGASFGEGDVVAEVAEVAAAVQKSLKRSLINANLKL